MAFEENGRSWQSERSSVVHSKRRAFLVVDPQLVFIGAGAIAERARGPSAHIVDSRHSHLSVSEHSDQGHDWMPKTLNRKSPWDLPIVALGLLLTGAFWFVSVELEQRLQIARCGPDAFMCGSNLLPALIQSITPAFVLLAPGLMVANWFSQLFRPIRRFYDRDAHVRQLPSYRKAQAGLGRFAVLMAAIGLPLMMLASLVQFCLPDAAGNRLSALALVGIPALFLAGCRSGRDGMLA